MINPSSRVFYLKFVAGAGLEPAPGGYEPPEIPLLHPAVLNNLT
tara:strand:- start:579 stop:710 length:132 start_codon:yes stop_codon:yes gene_type:complete